MTFQEARLTNPVVNQVLNAGGSAEDCVCALVESLQRANEVIEALHSIAPRKWRLPDGRVLVWNCPNELVPIKDISTSELRKLV